MARAAAGRSSAAWPPSPSVPPGPGTGPLPPIVGSFIARPALGQGQRAAWTGDGVWAPETPAPLCSLFGTIARVFPLAPGVISGRAPEGSHLTWALPTCGHRGWSPGPVRMPLGSTHGQGAPARRLPLGAQVPQSPHLLTSLHRSGVTSARPGDLVSGTEVTSEARAALPPDPWLGLQQACVEGGAGPSPGVDYGVTAILSLVA